MPTITIDRIDQDPFETIFGIRDDTSTRGVDLAGALVTASYADGTSENLVWQALDPFTNGGVTGADVDLFFDFDWHELTTTKLLTSLVFDLTPASSVFDTTTAMDTDPGGGSTPSSNNGFEFLVAPPFEGLTGSIAVTYSDIVNLFGSPAVGDLYTTMEIDFSGLTGGGLLGDLEWNSDMDTMRYPGDLVPKRVPETGDGGPDSLDGTTGADFLLGFGGDDTLNGDQGNDVLIGGNDNDLIDAGAGDDYVLAQGGADTVLGGEGIDFIFGGAGDDSIEAGAEADEVSGQGGADTILGDDGADTLRGGSGNDSISGGSADDQLFGNGNDDTLEGGDGADVLIGAAGADLLSGDAGNDTITGGLGADRLDGGTGNDVMNGGGADGVSDVFVFLLGYELDRINQFDQAGTDRIELDTDLWLATNPGLTEQQVIDTFGTLNGTGTILTLDFGGGDVLEIQNALGIDQTTLGADVVFV